ncbi:MAG: type II toxin-antitoxin system VapC family toxin [Planctomycetes bacterium]|nr:type II toxin-antitoxin system VapC family toxin [Planctomycetota bacterium]
MRLCVVDCSFAMAWVFEDEQNEVADALLARIARDDSIVVPAVLWGLEVRNALRTAVRRRRLTEADADQRRLALADLPKVTVSCPPGLGDTVDRLVRGCDLTSYDAIYLATALEHDLPLATADETLATAARRVGVARFGA